MQFSSKTLKTTSIIPIFIIKKISVFKYRIGTKQCVGWHYKRKRSIAPDTIKNTETNVKAIDEPTPPGFANGGIFVTVALGVENTIGGEIFIVGVIIIVGVGVTVEATVGVIVSEGVALGVAV